MVYVSEQLRAVRRSDLEDDAVEALWVEIRTKSVAVLVCNVYRPPDARAVWMEDFAVMMEKAALEKMDRFVLGDFNCNMLRHDSGALRLEGVALEYGLEQVISCPTRVTETSESMIDLLFTSTPDSIRKVGCKEVALSDHGLIYGIIANPKQKQQKCFRYVRCWSRCDVDALMSDLGSALWSVMDSLEGIDARWEYWKSLFKQIVDSHIPLRKARIKGKTLPWIGSDVRILMRARNYYCAKAKKTKKEEDWKQYRKLKNRVTWELKRSKLQYFEALSEQSSGNHGKELNKILGRGGRQSIEAVRTANGRITDPKAIVEELSSYFSLWSGVRGVDEVDADQSALPSLGCEFKFQKIEVEEVIQLLESLNVNKAMGLDGVSGKLLRMVAPAIARSLVSLFNFSLESGQVASEWKMARVAPVPKGSNSERVDNFRPVSVLSVVAKILERIVHRQLYTYLQEHSILHEAQSGFRPQHTTQDVLVSTIDDWRKALDEDKLVGSITLDLSKAFDTVSHSILHRKLSSYGVRAGELKWFDDYLVGRKQKVCIGAVQSDWSNILRGVPQGSILGPLLFTLYANDLPQAVVQGRVKQYADDTALYCARDNSADLASSLNTDLASVAEWAEVK